MERPSSDKELDLNLLAKLPKGPREKILVTLPVKKLEQICKHDKFKASCEDEKFWKAKLEYEGYILPENMKEFIAVMTPGSTPVKFYMQYLQGKLDLANKSPSLEGMGELVKISQIYQFKIASPEFKKSLEKTVSLAQQEIEKLAQFEDTRRDLYFQNNIIKAHNQYKIPVYNLPLYDKGYDRKPIESLLIKPDIIPLIREDDTIHNIFTRDLVGLSSSVDNEIIISMRNRDLTRSEKTLIKTIVPERLQRFVEIAREGDVIELRTFNRSHVYYYIYSKEEPERGSNSSSGSKLYLAKFTNKKYLPPQAIELILNEKPLLEDFENWTSSLVLDGFTYFTDKLITVDIDSQGPNYEAIAAVALSQPDLDEALPKIVPSAKELEKEKKYRNTEDEEDDEGYPVRPRYMEEEDESRSPSPRYDNNEEEED